MVRFILAAAVAALALAPASASADAVCTLQFDVRFDGEGRFTQNRAGEGVCAGNLAGVALDPGAANPSIGGLARSCLQIDSGRLELRPRRAFEMWSPEHLELSGGWTALGGALSGTLVTGGTAVDISGTISFAGSCSGAGRLHVELLLGNERPAPRQAPASAQPPADEESRPARSAPARKARSRGKRACRRAKSRRAAKRCRRARR